MNTPALDIEQVIPHLDAMVEKYPALWEQCHSEKRLLQNYCPPIMPYREAVVHVTSGVNRE